MQPSLTPQEFVDKWRKTTLKERSAAQEHFLDAIGARRRPALAHRKQDEAVLDAYGWPHELGDEGILEWLLALNRERAGRG